MNHSLALFGRRSSGPFLQQNDGGNANEGGENSGAITFKSQADLDAVIQRRLDRAKEIQKKELRDEIKDELRTELDSEKLAEDAKEQGKFEDLYKAEQAKVEKLEGKITELQDEIKEREKKDLRKKIASDHRLPDELVDRLQGETEEELVADAKALAKTFKVQEEGEGETKGPPSRKKPSDIDVGKGTRPIRPTGERKESDNGSSKPSYAFVKQGDVSWGA